MTDCPIGLECPDCGTCCPVRLTLLTSDGRIVELAACATCADGVTVKCYKTLTPKAYADAVRRGLPIVDYGRRK